MFSTLNIKTFLIIQTVVSINSQIEVDVARVKHGYPEMNAVQSRAAVNSGTFSVRIDHFNFFRRDVFNMRYLYSDEFYDSSKSGPMFVFLAGANSIDSMEPFLQVGLMYEMAKEMGAYMFMPEHRFYGESVPSGTLTTRNMMRLEVNQALADLVDFINNQKKTIPSLRNSKVVLFGGAYAANLATWMRIKYPYVVDAAVASSGPLKAQVNFFEYLQVVQRSLNNSVCMDLISNATDEILNKIKTNTGLNELRKDLNLCTPLKWDDVQEIRNLFKQIVNVFSTSVEYGTSTSIKTVCDTLINLPFDTPYLKLTNFVQNSVGSCLQSYTTSVGQLRSTDVTNKNRAWYYQKCAQFGYFESTDSDNQPFGKTIPLGYYQKLCYDVFGMFFSRMRTNMGVMRTNMEYGGLDPLVTQVVSTQGSLDPWNPLGLSKNLGPLAPVIVIEGASHCQDLLAEDPEDSQSLKDARQTIRRYIKQWISS